MTRKVTHEVKLPKSLTVAIYIIAVALVLNVAKPFIATSPAFAELYQGDRLNVKITNFPDFPDAMEIYGTISTCEECM